jgi:hypothetical protein
MEYNGNFVIVHRDGISGCFPASFHSVRIIGKVTPEPSLVHQASNPPRETDGPSYSDLLDNYQSETRN